MKQATGTTAIAAAGSGLTSPLFLIFLVLKLTGAISWSWWLVTAPLWAPGVLLVAILLVAATGFGAIGLYETLKKK